MITLNDYLYSGDTLLRILKKYIRDLRTEAKEKRNEIDLVHCNFLIQIQELLEHNDFLTAQSQKIREFYKYMAGEYPFLAFTFRGRIKSLIRAEEKFNGYVVEFIYDYYKEHGKYPSVSQIKERLSCFRDFIAYRIVIAMPRCHLKNGENVREEELRYLYEIANVLPGFLEERGFTAEPARGVQESTSPLLSEEAEPYYTDYGSANHLSYEKKQESERRRRDTIPEGECIYFDEAYERGMRLLGLDLAKLDVNMFGAVNNSLINDGCGLFRGRMILPYEHLSRFQNDIID